MDNVIVERLRALWNELAYLKTERKQMASFADYAASARARRAVERGLQISIEACLDIGRRIVSLEEMEVPDDNPSVFRILHTGGILPDSLLPTLLEMVRFRNLVVHDYTRIDDAIVHSILVNRLGDFESFAEAIGNYLRRP